MGLKQKIRKICKSAPAWAFGPHGPLYLQIQFKIRDKVRSGQDQFRLFPKSPVYKYVPYVIHKGRTSSRLQSTTLGAPPPLFLGFHPSKRHAALIVSCDQGSVVLAFYLGITRTEVFLMASSASYPDVRSMFLVDSSCFCCLASTNIMSSLRDHVLILY